MMLHLHPDLVEMDKAGEFVPLSVTLQREGNILTSACEVGFGGRAEDLDASGA